MRPEELRKKRVTVVGGARSGLAVARLLRKAGAEVFLTEQQPAPPGLEATLDALGVRYEFGGHTPRALEADLMVISPGVPSTAPLVQQARRIGLPVYSEIEVASWFCRAPIVAVTGTNGKTTTTSLIGYIFRRAGRRTIVAGNIGYPFSDYVLDTTPDDVVVLEVSSFQLDHVATFRPRVSVLLNITPDHLDRYNYNFNEYAQSKFRIFANQRGEDVLVYNHDDELIRMAAERAHRKRGLRVLGFSQRTELPAGAFVRDGYLILRIEQQEEVLMHANELALRGRHNLYNSLAAAVAARVMEVRNDVVRESLASFEGVPHRLEFVRELDGVRYVNDSKATNVNAVWYALESFSCPIVLIAGGRDKGNDYSVLKPLVKEKVRALVAIGESADKLLRELGPLVPHAVKAQSMEEAIQYARVFAEPGDVVLLSPACASFDMFENYEDRGDTFRRLVMSLQ
ncbi:UDP-N-acetylmuramoyl-L-alanine--D-glutamate ligase [Rhodothermus marinus]|uniref:UDP-N-acetylmuramoylalanine--D-glutamate ligase n=1 Tax=Rhodothermus marinus (strain ATCC 43812 / DSM 4252 / R-10) TaxID=518766 RepID=D0MGL1_RHOM4|nr:UDP-N-acetylmuramoyl-L-alanine--D-glutamate ligase [Rhodothermus marinus]ACY49574.1 UDP-N-acetylmuramoylalanine/D-glutamate ligase [Rhodothermus marinus DSM 4252]